MDKNKMKDSFRDEAVGHTLYMIYGDKARSEGLEDIARLFYDTAGNEFAHARMFFDEIYGNSSVENDLMRAITDEEKDAKKYHEWYADDGDARLKALSDIETAHGERFKNALDEFESGRAYNSDVPMKWRCHRCGFVAQGRNAPTVCPLCLGSQGSFHKM